MENNKDLYEVYLSKAKDYEYLAKKVNSIKGDIFEAELIIRQQKLELEALEPLVYKKELEMHKARVEWDQKHGK